MGTFRPKTQPSDFTNRGYSSRWKLTNKSADIEMYGSVHGDLFNVPRLLLPEVQMQIKFTKSKSDFYILSSNSDTRAVFKFQEATL